ncbi:hypothetical protein A2Z33_04425 [Candidatus Gottesmanbacteria bacterium RBG_16_52_11]|uniref:Uncharacterized protein n=1 Tax=Candidatus Gottesmanbacteria bacterium RBG_16_52_11 TaxID=1798374 RepID=A0A1F5YW12_9BACT|nr:MAG: hypothetical protein A2Z33_04425 [Candidatus Gottesmanbacteria bacterium RBG_16_52_11]
MTVELLPSEEITTDYDPVLERDLQRETVVRELHGGQNEITHFILERYADSNPDQAVITIVRCFQDKTGDLNEPEIIQYGVTVTEPETELPVIARLLTGIGRIYSAAEVLNLNAAGHLLEGALKPGSVDNVTEVPRRLQMALDGFLELFNSNDGMSSELARLDFSDLAAPIVPAAPSVV